MVLLLSTSLAVFLFEFYQMERLLTLLDGKCIWVLLLRLFNWNIR